MKLALSTWPEGTKTREFEESDESLGLDKDLYRFSEPIKVNLTVHKASNEVIIEGRVGTTAYADCVRCLEDVAMTVDETFRRVASIVPDAQVSEDSGDPDFTFLPESQPEWDLTEPLREIVMLALPDNPLCREDCQGLCPICGANRNQESCNCNGAAGRTPLAQLGELLDQHRKNGS
ncbi:MAG: hypothetical protein GF341_13045 [candidate division Zixibacteria bacterium]|nr:hypothetical protein [candidate division Zixibacteria bacterium]